MDLDIIPEEAKHIIKECLQIDPQNRPTIDQILSNPYLHIQTKPVCEEWELLLRAYLDDIIKRANVF